LLALGEFGESVTYLQRAVALNPLDALAHSNLGNGLMRLGRFAEAVQHHEQATRLAPEQIIVHTNLAHALKASGRPKDALIALKNALALDADRLDLHSQTLFLRQYELDSVSDPNLQDAVHFGRLAARQATARTEWPNARRPGKRLRVGLLSGDLREHPVGYFIESVLVALAADQGEQIEVFAYATTQASDALADRLRACCSVWREVANLSDGELAACICSDGVDVLIDLAGHTFNNRLPVLAWRPAPLQVSWLGYCATTGLAEVDAFIADPWVAPPRADDQFIEPVLRLPHTFLCFTPPQFDVSVAPLPALSGGGVRFGGFNDLAKMNDAVVAVWSRVLQAVPHSILVLQSAALQDADVRQAVLARYEQHGIPADQLELRPAQPRAEYLAGYGQIDISLDPFPYPGGTTTLESLWMGVPVLTLPGTTALSRQGLSVMTNLALTEWVATSEDDYVHRAVRHANDLVGLSALRGSLRPRLLASPLCDAPRFAQDFEAALRSLWQQYCNRIGADP
jgi:protein O-GlcNAc transferase